MDGLYRCLVRLREELLGSGPGSSADLLLAARLLSRLRPRDGVRYVIEDELHAAVLGEHDSLESAVSELQRLASIPWDKLPNVAPCQSWRTCGRSYELVEYDPRSQPWQVLSRTPLLEVDAKGVRWPSTSDDGEKPGEPGSGH